MQIQFNPDIGQTIAVSPPLLSSTAASYVTVRFTALIQNGEYGQMDEEGTKVQLWSNGVGGDWEAYDFTKDTQVTKLDTNQQLSLDLPVILPPGLTQLVFDYTYRILLSDGRVIWLGRFGQNGVCIVHRLGSHAVLSGDWYSRDAIAYELDTDGDSRSLEVLCGINMDDAKVYALNSDGALGFRERCSLLVILPKYIPDSYVVPQAFSVSSSVGTSMSLGSSGNICINGDVKTSLKLQVHDSRMDLLPGVQRAVAHSFTEKDRVISYKNGVVVFVSSTAHRRPLRLVAIELSSMMEDRVMDFQLDLTEQFKTAAEGASTLCIYPLLREIHIDVSTVVDIPMELGSQYILSPEHRLGSQGGTWRIFILSDYADIWTSSHDTYDSVLPTPPPSPPQKSVTSMGPIRLPATKFRAKLTQSSRFRGYMRFVLIFMFAPIYVTFWIWSTFVHPILGRSRNQGKIEAGPDKTRETNGVMEKHDHHVFTPTPARAISSVARHREVLHACVFPGLLTILLRPEDGGITDKPLNMLNIKFDGKQLDGTVEHKDDSTFLFTAHIDRDGEIEITFI